MKGSHSNLLKLRGRPLNPLLLIALLILNFFLILFPQSGSFNLDFFVIFTLLIFTFEINKGEGSLNIGEQKITLNHFSRNLFFLLTSFLLLGMLWLQWFWFNPPGTEEFMGNLIRVERGAHLLFSIILMFILYKTLLIDFGILISLVLLANLFYHLALKNILEIVFNIDYLKFLFQGQDIRREIQSLLNNSNPMPGSKNPLWENSPLNQRILETLLAFTGVLNNIFNTFYFVILTKITGSKIFNLNVRLSQIYFPRILTWVFIVNGLFFWFYINFSGFLTVTSKDAPIWEKMAGEVIISILVTLAFMYLIQGFSIFFAYIREQNFLRQPILKFPFLIFLSITLAISIILGMGIVLWINLFLICLGMIGFSDYWIDYRKHFHYQNFLTD